MSNRKKWMIALSVVGAAVLLLGGVGIAYAQRPDPGSEIAPLFGVPNSFGGGEFVGSWFDGGLTGGGPHRGGPFQGLIQITADVTGLSEEEVSAALKDGQTLAEIAEGADVDPQEIVSAALAEAESRLEEAVDDCRLTEDQMERVLDRLAEDLPERLEQSYQPVGVRGVMFGQFGEHFWTIYDAVAEG